MPGAEKVFGYNKVFCQGRFISGPDGKSCIASLLMILVPSIIWQVQPGAFFASRSSVLISLLTGCVQLASLVLLMATAFSDPGIMPRQTDWSEQYDSRTQTKRPKQPTRAYEIVLRGHPFKVKWCSTCNLYRPPRCTHCSVCENCIERFDHHCPWIGNCIGRRNYWLFYCFVTCTGAINAWVLATSAGHLGVLTGEYQDDGFGGFEALLEALREAPLSAALVVYCILIVWFTVGLCMYHNYLICTNQTTYEQIKGVYSSGHNPFNLGVIGNYKDVLLSPVRPRFFNPLTMEITWPKVAAECARELQRFTDGGTDQNVEDSGRKAKFSNLAPAGQRL
jgi:hypothetical protein